MSSYKCIGVAGLGGIKYWAGGKNEWDEVILRETGKIKGVFEE